MKNIYREVAIEFLVRAMLNPENKELFIDNLTIETVQELIEKSNEVEAVWKAIHIASQNKK